MTTVVDQVITIFDAIWKGDGAARSAAASLQKYQQVGAKTAIEHQKLAFGADGLRQGMMSLGSEVAKGAMTAEVAEAAFSKMNTVLVDNEAQMEKLIPTTTSLGGKFKNLAATAGVAIIALGAVAIALKTTYAAAKKVYDLAEEGAGIRQMNDSFNLLNASVMHTPTLLRDMVTATNGTISEMSAMEGIMTLVAGSSDELTQKFAEAAPKLAEIAKAANKLNPRLGDTNFMFASIARGVKRLEPRLLDNLGINARSATANKKFAEAMGISVEAMTAEQKVLALLNETLVVGDNLIRQVGGSVESAIDPYLQLAAATENYANAFKESLGAMKLGQSSIAENIQLAADETRGELMLQRAIEAGVSTRTEYSTFVQDITNGKRTWAEIIQIVAARLSGLELYEQEQIRLFWAMAKGVEEVGDSWMEGFGDAPQQEVRKMSTAIQKTAGEMTLLKEEMLGMGQGVRNPGKMDAFFSAQRVEQAKAMVDEIDDLIKTIRDLDAATGDYAMAAINADKESSLFNQTISEIGDAWVTVGGRNKEQNELLDDLRTAYDKAGQSGRDYETGIKGFAMTQDAVNKKLEEGAAAQQYYAQQIAELEGIRGEQKRTTTEATWNQENINKAILAAADAAGASASELINYQLEMGMLTEAQAEAALEAANMQEEIVKAGEAIANSVDPGQVEADIDRVKRAFERLTLDDLLGKDADTIPSTYTAQRISGYYEDAANAAIDPIGEAILGEDPDATITYLEEIRAGAVGIIELEGVEAASGELAGLLNQLGQINKTWTADININQNGNVPSTPGGVPEEQFGGPVQAGASYWVGERGPEMFVPNVSGRIIPNGQSAGGGSITINNYNRQAAAVAMTMLDMQKRAAF